MNQLRNQLEQLSPSQKEKITPPSYDDIILTEAETAEALRLAREVKALELKKQEWFEKVSANPVYKYYTAKELGMALLKTRPAIGEPYVVDEDNKHQVNQLCFYFSRDSRFVGDLNKGLMLMGLNGNGKSHLMAFFMQNQNCSYTVVKARDIENLWTSETKDEVGRTIDKYSNMLPVANNTNMFGHKAIGFCFDDLGAESIPSKRYGEEKRVMAEIIMNRYDNQLSFNATHITTNLNIEEFETAYGTRVRDRAREMFNVILFQGASRRK
jgi:DNA replication protein DnaC